MHQLLLSSRAFKAGQEIPATYTCSGANINPPLYIGNVPPDATSLTLIMHNPKSPKGDWAHWLLWNIHPDTTEIPEDSTPPGSIAGTNSFSEIGYGGPCPAQGSHEYYFELYALKGRLAMLPVTRKAELLRAIKDKIIAHGQIMGTCTAATV